MRCRIPKCLVQKPSTKEPPFSLDREGNRIWFAFSSPGNGKEFCDEIAKTEKDMVGWSPYNMDGVEDLKKLPGDNLPSEKVLVAINATGLGPPYCVVELASLIEAMEQVSEEIECFEYVPRERQTGGEDE